MKTICGRMPFSSTPNPSIIEQLIKNVEMDINFLWLKLKHEMSDHLAQVLF